MAEVERPRRLALEEDIVIDVLDCQADPQLAHAQLAARTVDVSEKGMKVWLYVPVPPATRVTLRLPDPDGLSVEGEIRWVKEGEEVRVGVLLDTDDRAVADWREKFELATRAGGEAP